MIGASFQPQSEDTSNGELRKKPSADAGVQEAIKVLSLRLPKVVGAQGIAPGALLNAQGARGDSRIDSIVNRVLSQFMPTGQPPAGQAPVIGQPSPGESGTMPPSAPVRHEGNTPLATFMPPTRPRIIPGATAGPLPPPEKGPTADQGKNMIDPALSAPSAPMGNDDLMDRLRRKYMGQDYEPMGPPGTPLL